MYSCTCVTRNCVLPSYDPFHAPLGWWHLHKETNQCHVVHVYIGLHKDLNVTSEQGGTYRSCAMKKPQSTSREIEDGSII